MDTKPIFVTQPSLAPLETFTASLAEIWRTGIMTHNGPFLQRLEGELAACLGVPDVVCVANGTLAMQLALRALDLRGEIITTPFSFIATASSIVWESCTPVFADIDPDTWNLDPASAAAHVTPRTVGLLPVHVFSAPCDIAAIDALARAHRLRVVYDAAHAMAVNIGGRSIMACGDIACTSFHATKLFNTCEGGACIAMDPAVTRRLRRLRFFGFDESKEVVDEGTNAKMTEIHAALGLANLPEMPAVLADRREKYALYQRLLAGIDGIRFQRFDPASYNFSYMPVLFDTEDRLLRVLKRLNAANIWPRRYFHPSLSHIPVLGSKTPTPVADDIARRIACLPLYRSLTPADIERICGLLLRVA